MLSKAALYTLKEFPVAGKIAITVIVGAVVFFLGRMLLERKND